MAAGCATLGATTAHRNRMPAASTARTPPTRHHGERGLAIDVCSTGCNSTSDSVGTGVLIFTDEEINVIAAWFGQVTGERR